MMSALSRLVLIAAVVLFPDARSTDYEDLYSKLMTTYKKEVRPGDGSAGPIGVRMCLYLYAINNLNGRERSMTVTAQTKFEWTDERLKWNESDYNGISVLTVPATDIYFPPVGLKNSIGSSFRRVDATRVFPVYISSKGTVRWDVIGDYKSSCLQNMRWFPFDTQSCQLQFGTLTQLVPFINMEKTDSYISYDYFTASEEFKVVTSYVCGVNVSETHEYVRMTEVQFWFILQRRPLFFLLSVLIPVIIIALLSALPFYIPNESGAGPKLGFLLSVMLTFAVFLLLLERSLPHNSQNIPVLLIYLSTVISIAGLNIFLQVLCLNLHNKHDLNPLPKCLRKLMMTVSGCMQCCKLPNISQRKRNPNKITIKSAIAKCNIVGIKPENMEYHPTESKTEEAILEDWTHLARLMENLFFLFFISVHAILVVVLFCIVFPWKTSKSMLPVDKENYNQYYPGYSDDYT